MSVLRASCIVPAAVSTIIGEPWASVRRMPAQTVGPGLDGRPAGALKPSNRGLPVDAWNVSAAAKCLVPAIHAARSFAVEVDTVRRL